MASLVLEQISKRFHVAEVLSSIDLSVEAGQRVAVTGESGSGKTTLLRIIAGLEQPSSGRVRMNSQDVTAWAANRRGVGIVFQDYATYPRMSVAENLTVSMVGNSLSKAEKESRLQEIAGWLGLGAMLRRLPAELSGGQLQRVALGKALMARPKLLLLDEPFSQLDVRLAEQMRRLLDECHQRYGMTQIMVTHHPMDALCSVDKLAILDKGRLVQYDTPCAVRQRPSTQFAAELTSPCGLNVLPAQALASLGMAGHSNIAAAVAAFRPESARIADAAGQGANAGLVSFGCRLGARHDLGIVRLQEAFVGDHKILVLCDGSSAHRPGQEVHCSIRREDLMIFPI